MADLLECLIQIKALRHTLEWTGLVSERELAEREPVRLWERMADAERRAAAALGTATAACASSGDGADGPRAVFAALRRANLVRLEGCTAAQLAGLIEWPGRPATTVADLVAIMLAHDTDALGEWRRERACRTNRIPSRVP
jgi:hypothetical protein